MDESNSIITLETHAVTSGSYNAMLSSTLTAGKTYTAYVVNYNGTGNSQRTSFAISTPSGGNNEGNNNSNNNSSNNNENTSSNSNKSNNQSKTDGNQVQDSSTKTGDENNLLLWIFLLFGFLAAFTSIGILKNEYKKIRGCRKQPLVRWDLFIIYYLFLVLTRNIGWYIIHI